MNDEKLNVVTTVHEFPEESGSGSGSATTKTTTTTTLASELCAASRNDLKSDSTKQSVSNRDALCAQLVADGYPVLRDPIMNPLGPLTFVVFKGPVDKDGKTITVVVFADDCEIARIRDIPESITSVVNGKGCLGYTLGFKMNGDIFVTQNHGIWSCCKSSLAFRQDFFGRL
jgi:hypothetical protein